MTIYVFFTALFAICHGVRTRRSTVQLAQLEALSLMGMESEAMAEEALVEKQPLDIKEKTVVTPTRRHPFPSFHLSDVELEPFLYCTVFLFLAGIMCSAGGLGGGGIYVTALMVAGQLPPHDAVPLSKMVVFLGSISSLILNLKKSIIQGQGEETTSLINFNICRIVVPAALLGTLVGVMMNSMFSPGIIVALLSAILMSVTFASARTCYEQWQEEARAKTRQWQEGRWGDAPPSGRYTREIATTTHPAALPLDAASEGQAWGKPNEKMEGSLMRFEALAGFLLLSLIVTFGVFRAHASACRTSIEQSEKGAITPEACKPPIFAFFLGERFLSSMMHGKQAADMIIVGSLAVPLCACLAALTYYGVMLIRNEGWTLGNIMAYAGMAFFAGSFAGLVGIGGGLVFSPFFLFMGVDPSISVATSATCVIFTSSSTTFQYLLMDRIIVSLGLFYGLVNLAASYVGTKLVHILHDKWHAKKSYISGIVCGGVFANFILLIYKLLSI